LVGCTGRPTWTYSNGGLSTCVHDVYRVTTCRPGRGHIVAAARLQLVLLLVLFLRLSRVFLCVHVRVSVYVCIQAGILTSRCAPASVVERDASRARRSPTSRYSSWKNVSSDRNTSDRPSAITSPGPSA